MQKHRRRWQLHYLAGVVAGPWVWAVVEGLAWGATERQWNKRILASGRCHVLAYPAVWGFWVEKIQVLLRSVKEVVEADGWGPG